MKNTMKTACLLVRKIEINEKDYEKIIHYLDRVMVYKFFPTGGVCPGNYVPPSIIDFMIAYLKHIGLEVSSTDKLEIEEIE